MQRRRRKQLAPRPPGDNPADIAARKQEADYQMGIHDDLSPALRAACDSAPNTSHQIMELLMRGISEERILQVLRSDPNFDRTARKTGPK